MAEIDRRPSDVGQTVQPDLTLGVGDDEDENQAMEDRADDRRGQETGPGSGDEDRGIVWPQGGGGETLRGPETLDDAGVER